MSPPTPLDPQFDDYSDLVAIARSLTVADTHLDQPPADLFDGILARVAKRPDLTGDAGRETQVPNEPAAVVPLTPGHTRRPSRLTYLLSAAAAILAVFGLVAVVNRGDDDASRIDAIELTNDGLEPAGSSSRGKATLVEESDGRYALDLDVSNLPKVDGFFELWIIDPQVKGMYSLGPVRGSGRYTLPDNVVPANFPIVDVSVEPTDGAPQHSGKSILRGKLTI